MRQPKLQENTYCTRCYFSERDKNYTRLLAASVCEDGGSLNHMRCAALHSMSLTGDTANMRSHAAIAILLASACPAFAQDERSFIVCPTQQELEQVVGSQNRFTPDDCRRMTITRVRSGAAELCVLDFARNGDAGLLDKLRQAAAPQQWWVACDELSRR